MSTGPKVEDSDAVSRSGPLPSSGSAPPPDDEIDTERWLTELDVDSRKTAEAIMKRVLPDLYQALVDAGDIED